MAESLLVAHKPRYNGLQVLRILAASMVVLYHVTGYASARVHPGYIWFQGGHGVDIFFVLSGFVMVVSSRDLVRSRDGWKAFAERRIVRVIPMYWFATTLFLAGQLFARGFFHHPLPGAYFVLASYLFLPCRDSLGRLYPLLGVGWTLNFEMFFYFLFTLALFFRRNIFLFIGPVLGALCLAAFFRRPEWPAPSFYFDTFAIEFFLGMLLAKLCLQRRFLSRAVAIPVACLSLGILFTTLLSESDYPRGFVFGIPAALLVWSIASLEEYVSVPAWALFLGDTSYVLYLFHPMLAPLILMLLLRAHLTSPWFCVLLGLASSVLVCSLIHRYIERPATNWLRERIRVRHQKVIATAL